MILLGCIARNFFGDYMDNYDDDVASWLRIICLAIILLRAGLELEFKDRGLMVIMLTLIP